MLAVNDGNVMAQVNCIYRMWHSSELQNYRSVQTRNIYDQFDLSVLALNEEATIISNIRDREWPPNMETVCQNLHRTTHCDKVILSYYGNDGDVLDSTWNSFMRLYPANGGAMFELNAATADGNPDTNNPDTVSTGVRLHPDWHQYHVDLQL